MMHAILLIIIKFSSVYKSVAIRIKKPIKTKFRLPVFNWTALKPNQINGTVFNEIDDERVLEVSLTWVTLWEIGRGVETVAKLSKILHSAAQNHYVTIMLTQHAATLCFTSIKENKYDSQNPVIQGVELDPSLSLTLTHTILYNTNQHSSSNHSSNLETLDFEKLDQVWRFFFSQQGLLDMLGKT